MKIKLYRIFNDWQYEGVIWLFSDPHFNDEDCLLMDKNWISPDEQVKRINRKVGKKDTVVFLGDIGDVSYIKKIKGNKVLIKGNHDSGTTNYLRKENYVPVENETREELRKKYPDFVCVTNLRIGKVAYLDNHLFDEVYEGPLFISPTILLSHEPIDLPFGINIHGHNHSGNLECVKKDSIQINITSNLRDYEPLRLDELINGVKVKTIHQKTIDSIKK